MGPVFSLQNVLEIRHSQVEALEIELGKLLIAQQEIQARLESLRAHEANLMSRLGKALVGEIDLVSLNLLRANALQVQEQIGTVSKELARKNQEVEAKRNELVAAKQAEETLQILKRKRQEIYLAELEQIESRSQDDIYIAMAFRNQNQEAF